MNVFALLIPVMVLATVAVLGVGIFSMLRGGEFNRRNANKLMRLRILFQFLAVILIMAALWMMGAPS
ncbi:twin transmembrane helix small protein [Oceanibacterium hippocampi]|uniref:HIG1 domain-containing protein n=1 Tax=Oceanibacterium hippocampi TaxID=745714 RepID=A0A1Y5RXS1_9PROT|nr:twin transmembrane helix small protein [Oceanibacterium hippocampi]SLN26619.1 hypothetical protein OCH7691_00834 [Oceanibacterium hippocampi]